MTSFLELCPIRAGVTRPGCPLDGGLRASEEREDFADGQVAVGLGQRQVGLDLVAVAAAVFVLDYVAGIGEIVDDAMSSALGDAQAGRDVAQPGSRIAGDAQQNPGMVGQETPGRHAQSVPLIHEMCC
jgi:hypothetical protein